MHCFLGLAHSFLLETSLPGRLISLYILQIKMYFTDKLRNHNVGVMQFGDGAVKARDTAIPTGK